MITQHSTMLVLVNTHPHASDIGTDSDILEQPLCLQVKAHAIVITKEDLVPCSLRDHSISKFYNL